MWAEFKSIAYAKANPGKGQPVASSGRNGTVGSATVRRRTFHGDDAASRCSTCSIAGLRRRSPDLLGGQVQVIFDNMPSIIQHVKSGAPLRALAVTTDRSDPVQLPDTPTVAENRSRL